MKMKPAISFLFSLLFLFSCGGKAASSSSLPVSFTNLEAASLIAKKSSIYGNSLDADALLLSCSLKPNDVLDRKSLASLLSLSFSSAPERTGARRVEGTNNDLSKITDISVSEPYYQSLSFLNDKGVLVLDDPTLFRPNDLAYESDIYTYLDRFFAYYGTNKKDDFYNTINHDYLFEDSRWKDKTKPLIDSDGDGVDDEEYVSDSRLIPSDRIYSSLIDIIGDFPDSQSASFLSTYLDQTHRKDLDLCGLYDYASNILACSNLKDLTDCLQNSYVEYGYAPFFRDVTLSRDDLFLSLALTSYSISGKKEIFAKGTKKYLDTIDTFKTNFKNMYSLSANKALELATCYADFKYDYCVKKEGMSDHSDSKYIPIENEYFGVEGDVTHSDPRGFCFYDFLKNGGVKKPSCMRFSSYTDIVPILELWNEEHFKELQAFCCYELGSCFWYCLPDEYVDGWFKVDYYGTKTEELLNDKNFGAGVYRYVHDDVISTYLGSEDYLSLTNETVTMINDLKSSMKDLVSSSSWLGKDSKDYCYKKLDYLSYCAGASIDGPLVKKGTAGTFVKANYKDSESGTLFGNILSYYDSMRDYYGENLGNKIADSHSFNTYLSTFDPLTANAFYLPSYNSINITLGFLLSSDGGTTKEDKLARLGLVVGHEISHGFDPNGIKFDYQGSSGKCPWSQEEKDYYENKADSISSFYDGYEVMPGFRNKGKTVLTEAVADMTGLKLSLSLGGVGFDYDHFFTSVAKNFARITTRYIFQVSGYEDDEHPFARARVNPLLSSCSSFASFYDLKEGDAMFTPVNDRPSLW